MNNEELLKECMYGKDIDFEISMADGSVKYSKPYQLRMKIEELLDAYKSELVERIEGMKNTYGNSFEIEATLTSIINLIKEE